MAHRDWTAGRPVCLTEGTPFAALCVLTEPTPLSIDGVAVVTVYWVVTERERDGERQRHRETETDRGRQRQRDRETKTEREREREGERQRQRQTE